MTNEEKITNILKEKNILPTRENFSWKDHSCAVAQYCPKYFDTEKFDWKYGSSYVAQYCPEKFDSQNFNWEKDSSYIPEYAPQHFDTTKYEWDHHSWAVAKYTPDLIDTQEFNWKWHGHHLIINHPDHKFIKHCIWNKNTIEEMSFHIREVPHWYKQKNKLHDLLDPTKRELLLNKVSKEIKLSKI